MSLTDTRPNGAPAPASVLPASVPAAKAALPRRRRPWMFAIGVVAVVLGFLGAYTWATAAGNNQPVLAVAATISAGHQITAADLKIVQVSAGSGLAPIAETARDQVIGKYARTELVAGTLLVEQQLTDKAIPGSGQQLIGLELKPSQLPARALRPGERVQLVITSDPRNVTLDAKGAAAQTLPNPPTFPATVAGVGPTATDGQIVIDVVVPAANGPGLLERASQGRVAISLVAG
ncbi:SAF domain-containing protein [Actinoplanes sp. G11-F43]|uniref:SAF domain-containing protein n=1 Tax=Actinoplanes sp. G11-F43 TaxID=3424130 RepID=UPI003D35977C